MRVQIHTYTCIHRYGNGVSYIWLQASTGIMLTHMGCLYTSLLSSWGTAIHIPLVQIANISDELPTVYIQHVCVCVGELLTHCHIRSVRLEKYTLGRMRLKARDPVRGSRWRCHGDNSWSPMSSPQTRGYVCRLTGHARRNPPSCDTPGKIPAGKETHRDKM